MEGQNGHQDWRQRRHGSEAGTVRASFVFIQTGAELPETGPGQCGAGGCQLVA